MGEAASLVIKMIEAFDRGDIEGSIECFAPDATFTNPVAGLRGRGEIRTLWEAFSSAFPGIVHEPKNIVEAGDAVAIEFVITATQTGTLVTPTGEIPATGKSVRLNQGVFARVAGGQIAEFHGYWDVASFMQQLGLVPEPAAATA
jgi:steroid delta-isomerase-like uncharacterized protein